MDQKERKSNMEKSQSFQNGRMKAEQELANKFPGFVNRPEIIEVYKGYGIKKFSSTQFGIFTENGEGFNQSTQPSLNAAHAWIDKKGPDKRPMPGSRVLVYGD